LQIIFLFATMSLKSQELQVPDLMLQSNYETLDSLYYTEEYTEKGKLYISAYLKKAKLEESEEEVITGYHLFADFYDNNYEIATAYIDSAIGLSEQEKSINHNLTLLYGKKAFIERVGGNFQNAINYYLKGLKLLDTVKNSFSAKYVKYNIGLIKRDYGDLEGAKTIFKKHLQFDKKRYIENINDPEGYLESYIYTIHELVRTYRLNKEIDSAKILNSQGLKLAKENNLVYLFILNEGIFKYNDTNYKESIKKIISTLPEVSNTNNRYDFEIYNLIDAYFYLGKSYEAIENQEQKLAYYKKIDSLTQSSNYLTPEIKLTYLGLVNHYKQLGDNIKQLEYLNKLIKIDSILDVNYKYINHKLEAEYDIPNLLENKEQLISTLKSENTKAIKTRLLISILLGISFLGLSFFYYKQLQYKKRFKALLTENKRAQHNDTRIKIKKQQRIDISEETFKHITKSLNQFERQEKYLKTNLTLDKIAKSFKTNSKYLSLILNQTKGKSVSQYINELRIEYVVNRLKRDTTFRKFTIKAIANEIGFNTDQAFSKAFFKQTGIYPSYFIKELEKKI